LYDIIGKAHRWQNLVEFVDIANIADIADITKEIIRQNMAEYGK